MTYIFLTVLFFIVGCASNSLPDSGPSRNDIQSEAKRSYKDSLQLIKISSDNIASLGSQRVESINPDFKNVFSDKEGHILGIGDRLLISIWEASGDGLFSTTEKKQTDIEATIDEEGRIFIPYVGLIQVAGEGIENLRKIISLGLEGKALEPQVQVKLLSNISNTIVTIGEVAKPGMYPIPVGGIQLLEALSLAGGSQLQTFETLISVVRGEQKAEIRLDAVLADSNNDIWLQANDTLQVTSKPKHFTALGAVRGQKRYTFESEFLSMSEALAQAGGLMDDISDSSGVFLFRFESMAILQDNGFELASTAQDNLKIPVIYQMDLSKAESFFLASQFMLQDKDLIYVSTAPAREYNKFLDTFVKPLLDLGRTGILVDKEINN
ncbi:MAG: polysaccharide biosynthesis/export family protein [Coraliomargaritaceae bacterium]